MSSPLPVVLLMGPTASGKTNLALQLFDTLPCSLISVDSALVYRGMNIGTAKPDAETLKKYPHALVDIRDPQQSYSTAEFRDDALHAIATVQAEGKIPVLVGGTMLYFKILTMGLADLPKANPIIRQGICEQAMREGWPSIHRQLATIDAVSAARIHPNDAQRLQRALEVWQITGKTLTTLQQEQSRHASTFPYPVVPLAVAPTDRALLHRRIEQRLDIMLAQGFIYEVAYLKQQPDMHIQLPAMKSVGYRQIWHYLEGQYSQAVMREKMLAATRQLAKRQFTWLRRWPKLHWLDSQSPKLYPDAKKTILLATAH